MAALKQAFHDVDRDGSGTIASVELHELARRFSMPGDDVELIMSVCDADGDGTLNIGEFERSLKVVEMRRAFMAVDKDGSGQINLTELHELAAAVNMTDRF